MCYFLVSTKKVAKEPTDIRKHDGCSLVCACAATMASIPRNVSWETRAESRLYSTQTCAYSLSFLKSGYLILLLCISREQSRCCVKGVVRFLWLFDEAKLLVASLRGVPKANYFYSNRYFCEGEPHKRFLGTFAGTKVPRHGR
jgi:hypothetical protein